MLCGFILLSLNLSQTIEIVLKSNTTIRGFLINAFRVNGETNQVEWCVVCVCVFAQCIDFVYISMLRSGELIPAGSAHAPATCSTQKAALTHGEPLAAPTLTFSYKLAANLNAGADSIKWGVTGLIGGTDKSSQVFYTLAAVTSVQGNSNNSGPTTTTTGGAASATSTIRPMSTAPPSSEAAQLRNWCACVVAWLAVAFL